MVKYYCSYSLEHIGGNNTQIVLHRDIIGAASTTHTSSRAGRSSRLAAIPLYHIYVIWKRPVETSNMILQ